MLTRFLFLLFLITFEEDGGDKRTGLEARGLQKIPLCNMSYCHGDGNLRTLQSLLKVLSNAQVHIGHLVADFDSVVNLNSLHF